MNMPDEQVLVVRAELLRKLGHFQGFTSDVDRYVPELLRPDQTTYRPRGEVEHDPSFKQLIPYMLFAHRDRSGTRLLFHYTRGSGQDEARLRRKRSIGIGGHISLVDAGQADTSYRQGMQRELAEEVRLETPYVERCVGLINDDETEVGSVHLGIVHLFEVEQPAVHPREAEIVESGFLPVSELLPSLEAFETWSQICLRWLSGTGCAASVQH
jgi:predicted NUDIX family phosphoesterase